MMVNSADTGLPGALADATERALAEAEIRLPPDVLAALRRAAAAERDEIARCELANILENITLAEERQVPICQDTGVPVVYLTLPADIPYTHSLIEGVREGVRRATATIPLRPNVVDPLTRKNTGDNT
ncbi:MAG: fumarate hydratase, partial [Methanoculleus sp.]|nr:fumarate hydratase [Methanoculleus sp.]